MAIMLTSCPPLVMIAWPLRRCKELAVEVAQRNLRRAEAALRVKAEAEAAARAKAKAKAQPKAGRRP